MLYPVWLALERGWDGLRANQVFKALRNLSSSSTHRFWCVVPGFYSLGGRGEGGNVVVVSSKTHAEPVRLPGWNEL